MTTNNILNKIALFAAGAVVGSVVTWKLVKTKYERIAQEEIDSVKEYYANRSKDVSCDNEESADEKWNEEPVVTEEEKEEYKELIEKCEYATESNETKTEIQNKKESEKEMDRPYVISPEEFAESERETITLRHYANDVLVDEFGGVMPKDIWEEYVGADFATHFGDYEYDPDVVYVRNETFGIDYEILKELDDYTEDK